MEYSFKNKKEDIDVDFNNNVIDISLKEIFKKKGFDKLGFSFLHFLKKKK